MPYPLLASLLYQRKNYVTDHECGTNDDKEKSGKDESNNDAADVINHENNGAEANLTAEEQEEAYRRIFHQCVYLEVSMIL